MTDELEALRMQVDKVDDQILKALTERVQICREIGVVKKKRGVQVRDAARENSVFMEVKAKAVKSGLNPLQVEAVFREIVNMCSAVQE